MLYDLQLWNCVICPLVTLAPAVHAYSRAHVMFLSHVRLTATRCCENFEFDQIIADYGCHYFHCHYFH